MSLAPHVLFAAGGSANHLYPGMAVAEHLRRRVPNMLVTFAGDGAARERRAVRAAGYQYTMVPTHPTPRNPLQAVRYVTDNTAGYFAARWMLREQRVSLVVSLGGSTSSAVVRSAAARGIPVILLEQNAVPNRTTRWLSRAAAMACVAFEETKLHLAMRAPISSTGLPVRTSFEQLHAAKFGRLANASAGLGASRNDSGSSTRQSAPPIAEGISKKQRRLVILGGSGGAKTLNQAMPAALKRLSERLPGWQIVHQSGEGQLAETESRYVQQGVSALVVANVDDVASVLFASDLVVCRSGGSQLAELAMAGVPALLVPFPQSADDHQRANAKVFAAANACRVVDESLFHSDLDAALARELDPLIADHHLRAEMGRCMLKLARPQAAAQVAAVVLDQLSGAPIAALAA